MSGGGLSTTSLGPVLVSALSSQQKNLPPTKTWTSVLTSPALPTLQPSGHISVSLFPLPHLRLESHHLSPEPWSPLLLVSCLPGQLSLLHYRPVLLRNTDLKTVFHDSDGRPDTSMGFSKPKMHCPAPTFPGLASPHGFTSWCSTSQACTLPQLPTHTLSSGG